MSATGRGSPRVDYDYYPTPTSAVHQLLRAVVLPGGPWLEPGAGDGAIIRAVNEARTDVDWTACEIQPRFRTKLERIPNVHAVHISDFRKATWVDMRSATVQLFNVAIGNPPFSSAANFVHSALRCSRTVFMLLRLNWLGSSAKRRWLFECCGVPSLYVLEQRPSFHPKGRVGKSGRKGGETDACDYAWMRWHADGSQRRDVTILRGDR